MEETWVNLPKPSFLSGERHVMCTDDIIELQLEGLDVQAKIKRVELEQIKLDKRDVRLHQRLCELVEANDRVGAAEVMLNIKNNEAHKARLDVRIARYQERLEQIGEHLKRHMFDQLRQRFGDRIMSAPHDLGDLFAQFADGDDHTGRLDDLVSANGHRMGTGLYL